MQAGRTIVIDLSLAEAGQVLVQVVGPDGKPVPDATIAWVSEDTSCVPVEPATTDEAGTALVGIGLGVHEILVSASGYAIYRGAVTVEGGVVTYRAALAPSAVHLTKSAIEISDRVLFGSGNAVIMSESHAILDDVAELIRASPTVGRIEVGGHTDSRGSESSNLRLSQQRADAIRSYLIGRGVSPGDLTARGYGESDPIDSNRTAEGREANRRVEFRLGEQP